MSKKREKPKIEGGNGQSLDGVVPPLSDEEFAEMVGQFKKRGLPVILYVFAGPESISASRLVADVGSRQMAAMATEIDEWSRLLTRAHIASMKTGPAGVAKPGILLPRDLKGPGQG